jgi:hypothetical protein
LPKIKQINYWSKCPRPRFGEKTPRDEIAENPVEEKAEHSPALRDPRVARIDRRKVHGLSLSEVNFPSPLDQMVK